MQKTRDVCYTTQNIWSDCHLHIYNTLRGVNPACGSGNNQNIWFWFQLLSHVQLFVTPWIAARQAGFPVHHQLLKLTQTHVGDALQPSVIPFSSCLQSFPALVFSNESFLHIRWPRYWSFSFSISPPNEYSGLISFRMDCLDLLAVQGILKSLLQHHSSKASILWCSAFFIVQISNLYMTTGKTIALTRWTFVGKGLCFLICCLGWS